MLLDDRVMSTIDDPSVARFILSDQPASARGVHLYVVMQKEGTTMMRAVAGDVATELALQTDPSLPSPPPSAAGARSR
jgi:hypothetical protein